MTRARLPRNAALLALGALVLSGLAVTTPASAVTATSSVIALRSGSAQPDSAGNLSLVYKTVGVGSNTDGRVAITGTDNANASFGSWGVSFPRKTAVGTYLFDPNGGTPTSWTADTRCSTGPGTAKAVVHDAAWTTAGVPTRLSLSLTFPCGHYRTGTTSVEIRYAEPTTSGVGEAAPAPNQQDGSTTVGTPVAMTRTFTNVGTAPAVMGAASVVADSNPKYPSFFVTGDGCKGTTLAPAASCTVTLSFDPPVASNPTAVLAVPDGRPVPATAALGGSAKPEPDQPVFVTVAGSLGAAVVSWYVPTVSSTNGAYDGFEVLAVNGDGSLGAVVATSGPTPAAQPRTVEVTGLPDRTAVRYAVRAILPGGARGPASVAEGDTTVGRLLIARGQHGIAMRGMDPLGNTYLRWAEGSPSDGRRLVVSPDRSTLAFAEGAQTGTGYSCSVSVMARAGLTAPTFVAQNAGYACDDYPTFTSDSTVVFSHVADASQPASATPSLQSYDLGTGLVTAVVGGAGLTMPAAAPDGTIVAVDPATSSLVRVTPGVDAAATPIPNTTGATNPAVDPVTGRIAFLRSNGSYARNLTVVAADGSSPTPLTFGDVLDSAPSWDGARIYFAEGNRIWHADSVTGVLTQDTTEYDTDTAATPVVLDVPDTTAPSVTTTALPAYSRTAAAVTVTATDPGPAGAGVAHLDAELASGPTGPWSAPAGWTGATSGAFSVPVTNGQQSCFHARATDAVGNTSAWTTPVCVTGDTTAPALTSLSTPAAYSATSKLAVTQAYGDSGSGLAKVLVRYRRAAPGSGFGPFSAAATLTTSTYTLSMAAGYQYCASFEGVDKAGNASAWSVERCAIAALDDRSLAVSGSAVRLTGTGYHAGTITQLKATGAALTYGSVSGRQLGLLVRVCSTCGYLDVYVGTARLARISTGSSTTRNQVLLWLPRQSTTRTGKLTVRQVDSRTTFVDAVVVQHQ